jgi:hypothetical protein
MRRFLKMKQLTALLVISLFFIAGCNKDDANTGSYVPPSTPPVLISNTAPIAIAGSDTTVVLPVNEITLFGRAIDQQESITRFSWKKIEGPSCTIESPASAVTSIRNLEKGTYKFELTVTDSGGLTGKAVIQVYVVDPPPPGPHEVIINNQRWGCPMGCYMLVKCLKCYVPQGVPFTVYIKSANTDWIQVLPMINNYPTGTYGYFIYQGDLEIISVEDETYTVSQVKIKY